MSKKHNKVLNFSFEVLTDNSTIGATNEEIIYGLQRGLIIASEDNELQDRVDEDDCSDSDEKDSVRHNSIFAEINDKRQGLIDEVLSQIDNDINHTKDLTALDELLKYIPSHILKAYLPEE